MSRNHILHRSLLQKKQEWFSQQLLLPEQLIIRVGKACNFRCIFCNVAENESILLAKPKIKEILVQTFYRIKYSNLSSWIINITISWWEPSLFQTETIFVMKYFKKYFNDRSVLSTFEMQSNASNITEVFAKKLKRLWLYDVMVSYHTHDPKEYRQYIGVDYEKFWEKINNWINNLIKEGISVSFNIILSHINKDSYFKHICFLLDKFPDVLVYNIWFVQPHWMAQDNYDLLFVQYSEVYKIYNKVIAYLKFKWKKAHSHLVGLPLCYMNDYSSVMEYYHNRWIILDGPQKHTLIQKINDDNKAYDSKCNSCKVKWLCSWIWKEYIWKQRIKPVPYIQFSNLKHNPNVCVYTDQINLKKVRDTWIDQIFVLGYDIRWKQNIWSIISHIRKYQFHMISLVIDDVNQLMSLDNYYSINIQLKHSGWDIIPFIYNILDFNNSVSSQFHIRLDIHTAQQSLLENPIIQKFDGLLNIHKYRKYN